MPEQKKTVAAWLVQFGVWIAPFIPVVIGSGAKVRDLCDARSDIESAFDIEAATNEWTSAEIEEALDSLVPEFGLGDPATPPE